MDEPCYDCLVIGGGPAGLTAAIYLTRYHLSLKVIDAGKSRAGWIPCSHNHAGYPGGINGKELLRLMREQAQMRLEVLKKELETGREELEKVEKQRAYLQETVLRISGAVQVLEELLAQEAEQNGGAAETPQHLYSRSGEAQVH